MRISTIIVNYNGFNDTLDCLNSIFKADLTGLEHEVILVNAYEKENNEGEKLKSRFSSICVLDTINGGYVGNNNIGIKTAIKNRSDIIILLNNDTVVDKNLFKVISRTLKKNEIGAVSPKIYFYPGNEFHSSYKKSELGKIIWYAGGIIDSKNYYAYHRGVDEFDHGQFDRVFESDYISGCCMAFRTSTIQEVGLFDPKYFLYYEDTDLSIRIKKSGYRLLMTPEGKVWHKNAGSTAGSGSNIHVYYQTRNRLIFGMKYASFRTKIALFKEALIKLKTGNETEKSAITDFLKGKYGKHN